MYAYDYVILYIYVYFYWKEHDHASHRHMLSRSNYALPVSTTLVLGQCHSYYAGTMLIRFLLR